MESVIVTSVPSNPDEELDAASRAEEDKRENANGKRDLPTVNSLPLMATVAMRKKVVSIAHFSPSFCLQCSVTANFVVC